MSTTIANAGLQGVSAEGCCKCQTILVNGVGRGQGSTQHHCIITHGLAVRVVCTGHRSGHNLCRVRVVTIISWHAIFELVSDTMASVGDRGSLTRRAQTSWRERGGRMQGTRRGGHFPTRLQACAEHVLLWSYNDGPTLLQPPPPAHTRGSQHTNP